MEELQKIQHPATAVAIVRDRMPSLDHEEAWALYLTSTQTLIGTEMLAKGTLDELAIDCRTVLRQVLLHNAASLILLHNHPSGDPAPSQADIRFTEQLNRACNLLDIHLIDHIITAKDSFFSFHEEKSIPYDI